MTSEPVLPAGHSPAPLTETVLVDGKPVLTLKELVSPSIHTLIVGINPPPPAVAVGHYYQGRLGRQLWRCMRVAGIGNLLESDRGQEDSVLFHQGFGFMDLVRRPTARASQLRSDEWRQGGDSLIQRVADLACRPCVVMVYKSVADIAGSRFHQLGYRTFTIGCTQRRFREERFHELAFWLHCNALPMPTAIDLPVSG